MAFRPFIFPSMSEVGCWAFDVSLKNPSSFEPCPLSASQIAKENILIRMDQRALVIVPTYNERDNLPPLVAKLLSLPVQVDLLVVDDNSPDGTGRIADELAARHPQVNVLHRSEKNGLGRAYCAGFAWALERDYEYILEMDGDFSHNPEDIAKFLEAAKTADLVIGSRYCNGIRVINWPLTRLMLSMSAGLYVRIITGMPFSDPTGGFKCFRRNALKSIDLDRVRSNGYSFQIELTHKLWRKSPSFSPTASKAPPRFRARSSMKPSSWSGVCSFRTASAAGPRNRSVSAG
jgi:dolichol-phosphate mannosyltransferase